MRVLLAEDDPVIQGYDEPEWARRLHYDRPIASSVAVLGAVRAASHQLLTALTPDEWQRSGSHSESGPYSVGRWLDIYAEHGHEHPAQLDRGRLLAAPRVAHEQDHEQGRDHDLEDHPDDGDQ